VTPAAGAACEVCGSELAERQRWCLACGSGRLTALAAAPHWRVAGAAAVLVGMLALAGIGYAVATLISS
jgi:hypothetical protein